MPQDNSFEEMAVITVLIGLITAIIRMTVRAESLNDLLIDTSLGSFSNFQAVYIQQAKVRVEKRSWFLNLTGQELSWMQPAAGKAVTDWRG